MPLSEQEIKNLLEKAKAYGSRNKKALECLNTIIKNTSPQFYYFSARAAILCDLGREEQAIEDINKAIELNPDQGGLYLLRGEILLTKVQGMKDKNVFSKENNQLLEKVVTDYKVAVGKNPSLPLIWLNLIEFNILLHKWDDAISIYGSARPYIDTKEDQLIRSWLGCVALALAGDPIEEEDKKPLYDQTIKITGAALVGRIISPSFHREIIEMGASTDGRWEKLVEIHKLFLEHFHDLHSLKHTSDALEEIGCYEEALEVCDRAIMLAQNKYILSEILLIKGSILEKLKRNEESLKAYDNATELLPWPKKLFLKTFLFFKKRSEQSKKQNAIFRYRTAQLSSVKGDKEIALANLSEAIELDGKYKEDAKKEEDFKNFWDDEDFKRIVG